MTKLVWDAPGTRLFEAGVEKGVLYVGTDPGVPWPGLISVSESPVGGEVTSYYLDGVKYLQCASSTQYEATIEAYYSPQEFDPCEGYVTLSGITLTDQPKKSFGLCYKTQLGDDLLSIDRGYKLHLVYGALAEPAERTYSTIGDNVEPVGPSWKIKCKPIVIPGRKPVAHIILNSLDIEPSDLHDIEQILYGTNSTAPRLPYPDELFNLHNYIDGGHPGDSLFDFVDGGGTPTTITDFIDGGIG